MQVGDVLDGKYQLTQLLGESGMGLVYRAQERAKRRDVAIKLIFPHVALDDGAVDAFLQESEAAGRISSPHLVRVFDSGINNEGAPYIVRPFLKGRDLGDLLAQEGRLAPGYCAQLIRQACAGLAAAHAQGICHWNLKPKNIFLSADGGGVEQVRLLDFGMSVLRDSLDDATADATVSGASVGMPYYLPIELFRATLPRDQRADVYSLGALLYEMLSGVPPYESETYTRLLLLIATRDPIPLHERLPQVSEGLAVTVAQAIEREPQGRFSSVLELAEALESAESDEDYREQLAAQAAERRASNARNLAKTRPAIPLHVLKNVEVDADTMEALGQKRKKTRKKKRSVSNWVNYLTIFFFAVAALLAAVALYRGCLAEQQAPAAMQKPTSPTIPGAHTGTGVNTTAPAVDTTTPAEAPSP